MAKTCRTRADAFIDGQFVIRDSVLPWSAGSGSSHKCLALLECAPISRTITGDKGSVNHRVRARSRVCATAASCYMSFVI
jgi:hypothetical protein